MQHLTRKLIDFFSFIPSFEQSLLSYSVCTVCSVTSTLKSCIHRVDYSSHREYICSNNNISVNDSAWNVCSVSWSML